VRSTGKSAATARSRDGIEPAASANCPPNQFTSHDGPAQQRSKEASRRGVSGGIPSNTWRECARPVYAAARNNGARKQRQARQAKGQEEEQAP